MEINYIVCSAELDHQPQDVFQSFPQGDEKDLPITEQELEDYPGEDFQPDPPRPGTLAPGQTLEEFCDLYQEFS